jgi:hypothetical protein
MEPSNNSTPVLLKCGNTTLITTNTAGIGAKQREMMVRKRSSTV